MTDAQINQAIAEACGWGWFQKICTGELLGKFVEEKGPLRSIPDYCDDLNAMHEAEKVLDTIEQGHYWDHLKDLTDEGFDQLHATARQRAEAFLRTLGKWEEVQA